MVLVEERKHQINEKILEYLGFQGLFNKMRGRHKEWRGNTHTKQELGCVFMCIAVSFFWCGVFLLGFLFWVCFFLGERGKDIP